ncbi:MAG: hypothetical protein WBR10_08810 [Candidatus Acidiferrum sp.]
MIPTRTRPASAVVFALMTVLALLAAPMCAPLCAARNCSSGARQVHCHGMDGMGAGDEQFIAPGKTCGAADFSAVLSKSDEQNMSSRGMRSDSAPVLIGESYQQYFESLRTSLGHLSAHRIPLEFATSLLLIPPLRI